MPDRRIRSGTFFRGLVMLLDLLPHLVNGLTLGLLFALVALGFMLIVGLMEQINLAHGSLFALGAYLALAMVGGENAISPYLGETWRTLPLGARYVAALIVAPILVAIVGMGVEVLMRRTYGKDPLFGLLLTFGVAMVLEEAIRATWSTRDYVLQTPGLVSGGFIFQNLIWSTYRFYAAAFAATAILLVWLFIEKTPYGAVIKAGAHDNEIVRALGHQSIAPAAFRFCVRNVARGTRRNHSCADLGYPSAHGCRRGGPGISRDRARRNRQLLGRGRCVALVRDARRSRRRVRVRMVATLHLSLIDRRHDVPRTRLVRQEKPPRGVRCCQAHRLLHDW